MKKICGFVFLVIIALGTHTVFALTPTVVGGDSDSHGCKGSAGYSWNEKSQKCERPWENNMQEGSTKPDCEVSVRDLKFGDGEKNNRHEDVKSLQKHLISLGFLKIPTATGYFGSITKKAVMKYQEEHKIKATGYMGALTRTSMKNHGCRDREEVGETDFPGCKTWFDGCNTCTRSEPGKPAACTLMACIEKTEKPYCKEYLKN